MEVQRQPFTSAPTLRCWILVGGAKAYRTRAQFVVSKSPGSFRLIQ